MRSLLRKIPENSRLGRLKRAAKKALRSARVLAQDALNQRLAAHYPEACREAFGLLLKASERLPYTDAPLTRRYLSAVFDRYLWTCGRWDRSILDVLNTVRAISSEIPSGTRIERNPRSDAQKLKILFVTSMFPGAEHGGGLRVFDMITELADRGHQVSLYSPEDFGGTTKTLDLLKDKLASFRLVKPGCFLPNDFEAWLRRENVRYDATHYVWPYSSTLMPTGKAWTKNSVFELIESCSRRCLMDLERYLKVGDLDAVGRGAFHLLDNWKLEHDAVSHADRVIALTDADAAFTSQLFGVPQVDVIPQGISKTFVLDRVQQAGDTPPSFGEHSAVFIGNYNHYPNKDGLQWFVSNVLPKVTAKVPTFKFIVAGAGDISSIKGLLDSTPAVEFIGEVDDLVGTLQSAKICIAPLISGAGIRGKVNQYSCVRRPTVSTRIGACGTPYQHEESIMIADDPSEFAEHVVRLLRDNRLYEKIRSKASEVAIESFSWGPIIRNLEAIYAE